MIHYTTRYVKTFSEKTVFIPVKAPPAGANHAKSHHTVSDMMAENTNLPGQLGKLKFGGT